jgi:hypothetical protein
MMSLQLSISEARRGMHVVNAYLITLHFSTPPRIPLVCKGTKV